MNAHVVPHILTGEILGPRDDIRVVASLHPLRQERVERRMPAGLTLAEMVERIVSEPDCRSIASDFIVHIDGHVIAPAIWHCVRPKPSAVVTMHPTLADPISALITGIAGALKVFTAAITAMGFFGKVLMWGLGIGAKLLMNALFAPRPQKQETPKIGYSFSGARNQAAPFEAIPVILGRHRVAPFYAARPYTETVGSDQYLRCLFVWGYGPLQVEDLKIGETALSSFENVEIQTYQGFPGDPQQTLYPSQVVEEPLNIELKLDDDWVRRTTAENVNYISADFVMPNGCVHYDTKGRKRTWTVTAEARYRPIGGSAWTTMAFVNFTDSTVDTLRRTVGLSVPNGQYEVETKKTGTAHDGKNQIVEQIIWTALRGFRPGKPVAFNKPLCITAIRIKASSQLNGTLDTLNGIVTSLVKSWSGTEWVDNQPSRNPADLFRHVLQGAANARPRSDAQIDLAALQGWADYCKDKGWTFDMPRVTAASVFDTLSDIAAAGRAMPIFKDGKWSVIWDEQDSPVVQMFTPRNSWGFEASHEFRELPHGWRTKFINEKKNWVEDERIVYDDGYDATNATRFEGLEFPGVTNPDLIWKHGRFHLAQLRLRPETYTINVDFENLIVTRGDRVRLQHDVMLLGLASGRVRAVDAGAQTVELDEVVTMDGAKLYQARFRLADGSFIARSVVPGSSGETTTLAFEGSGDLPDIGDLFTFGEANRESAIYRVLGIETLEDAAAKLTLIDDALGIYEADTGVVPAFESNVTQPLDPYSLPPTDIRLTESVYQEGEDWFEAIRLNWKAPRAGRVRFFEVEYFNGTAWKQGPIVPAPQTTAEVRGLIAGVYTFRVRGLFDDDGFSSWATTAAFSADMLNNPPPDVEDFAISVLGDTSTLTWAAVNRAGVTYEIRFSSIDNTSVGWNSATPLMVGLSGTSVQAPSMVGSYLIKAVLQNGLKSLNASIVATNIAGLADLNAVELLIESPAYIGFRDNVIASNGVLRLLDMNVMAKWETLDDVILLALGDGEDDSIGVHLTGTYYFDEDVDLGAVFTSRLTATVDASGENVSNVMALWTTLAVIDRLDDSEPEDWGVALEYRTTDVDPALDGWGAWLPFFVGDVTARAFQFRLRLDGSAPLGVSNYSVTTPAVRRLTVQVDMPDRVVAGNDIAVPTAGITVSFAPPFISLQGLGIADQNMATGDRKQITAKGPDGFHIQFFNAAGAPVERTIDYVAKGYGAMQ